MPNLNHRVYPTTINATFCQHRPPFGVHPLVRDLYWAINSDTPYALTHITPWQDNSNWFRDFITRLSHNPQPLIDFMGSKRRILGHYFEALWQFYMTHHPRFDLLASNIQLIINGITLGEIDLVVYDQQQQCIIQLELACKFYLYSAAALGITDSKHSGVNTATHYSAPISALSQPIPPRLITSVDPAYNHHWIGTGKTDRLSDKYQSLVHKQLRVRHNPHIQALLARQNIVIDYAIAIVKGRSFVPLIDSATKHTNALADLARCDNTQLSAANQLPHLALCTNNAGHVPVSFRRITDHHGVAAAITYSPQGIWLHNHRLALLPRYYTYAPLAKYSWLANNSSTQQRLLSHTELMRYCAQHTLPLQVACFNPRKPPHSILQSGRILHNPQFDETLRVWILPDGW